MTLYHVDNRRTVLTVGQVVCFNFCGQIARGVIREIKERRRTILGETKILPKFIIDRTHPSRGQSIVLFEKCVMAIFEGEEWD